MNVPPPFSPPPTPRKKNNTGLIIGIVLACVLIPCIGVGVLMLLGVNWVKNTAFPMASCAIGFEQVRQAIGDYADAHDGKFPQAETWQDDVKSYYGAIMKNRAEDLGPIKPMDPNGDWGCKIDDSRMTGMAFNSELSGKKVADVKDPYGTVLIFEIEKAMKNAHEKYRPRSKASSPQIIMGESRGWLKMMVKGRSSDGFGDEDSKFKFKVDDK